MHRYRIPRWAPRATWPRARTWPSRPGGQRTDRSARSAPLSGQSARRCAAAPPALVPLGRAHAFAAVAASPTAFREIWLETNDTARNLPAVARDVGANVLFAGFDPGRVSSPLAAARAMPSPSGRVRRLPDPALPDSATPAMLVSASSKLTHALEGGGMAVPVSVAMRTSASGAEPSRNKAVLDRVLVRHQ
jgi:hypothetical protein